MTGGFFCSDDGDRSDAAQKAHCAITGAGCFGVTIKARFAMTEHGEHVALAVPVDHSTEARELEVRRRQTSRVALETMGDSAIVRAGAGVVGAHGIGLAAEHYGVAGRVVDGRSTDPRMIRKPRPATTVDDVPTGVVHPRVTRMP